MTKSSASGRRPITIMGFSIWAMVSIVIVFTLLVIISYRQIQDAESAFTKQRKLSVARHLAADLAALQEKVEKVAQSYSNADETRQQFHNSQYYLYWRDSRVKDNPAFAPYINRVELYTKRGFPMTSQLSEGFPGQLSLASSFLIQTESDVLYIYHVSRVHGPIKETGMLGFLVIKYNLANLVLTEARLSDIDKATLGFALSVSRINDLIELAAYADFDLLASSDIEDLIGALSNNMITIGMIVPIISIISLVLFTYMMIKPIRNFETLVHELGRQNIEKPASLVFRFDELRNIWRAILDYRELASSMHSDLDEKNKELWELAHHDPLTGCFNRRAFEEDWQHMLGTIEQRRISLAFVLFDCDRFKLINDNYGHNSGDQVLIHISNTIQNNLRAGDRLYRLGGDEFCTILFDSDKAEARAVATRCLTQLDKTDIRELGINEPVRMSIGIAISEGTNSESLHDLQRLADIAMYYAKRPDNQNIAVYDASMLRDSLTLLNNEVITSVYDAISNKEGLQIHYQPIIDLQSNVVHYYEALSRLEHDGKLLYPDVFLPIVQDRFIEAEFDQLVIQHIQRDLGAGRLPAGSGVSINISGAGVTDKQVVAQLGALSEYLDEYHIYIEVTETSLITRLIQASEYLERLRQQGFKISLDDFGSGYSSLGYLTQMPVDCIKFDLSLVQALHKKERKSLVVRSLADMCLKAGYQIVAEGIEDVGLLNTVTGIGFTHAQGYYIGKPDKVPRAPVAT
ncbi:MAG: EAL domain-containing protein [Gammaproteobacteria bacterium]|nr:EAL domain-containing protein [Gammaproteobacteria bacterium]